jgi:uncharacterized membrane protein/thiol-disulfide isomerase/thioredoxin
MKINTLTTIATKIFTCLILLLLLVALSASTLPTPSPPIVHAILFYSPSCPHCQYVVSEVLPPLFEKYGVQLSMVGIDISQSTGYSLFLNTLKYFDLQQGGVPFLVVGDTYLLGSIDIPDQFPTLIENYISQGGIGWPAIPGLIEVLSAPLTTQSQSATPLVAITSTQQPTYIDPTPTPTPGIILAGDHYPSITAAFSNDLLGNSLSVIILVAMIFTTGRAAMTFRRPNKNTHYQSWQWVTPVLCIVGLFIAGYLAFVETNQVEAVCGPVGDCNTVQQSEYARLFGILPVGIIGIVGYAMILISWFISRYTNRRTAAYASLFGLTLSGFGVLFSIYLTFLEPFVIGATCAWCLTSSVIMTALLWLSIIPGKQAFTLIFLGDKHDYRKRSIKRTF